MPPSRPLLKKLCRYFYAISNELVFLSLFWGLKKGEGKITKRPL